MCIGSSLENNNKVSPLFLQMYGTILRLFVKMLFDGSQRNVSVVLKSKAIVLYVRN